MIDRLEDSYEQLKPVNNGLKLTFLIISPHYCLGRGFVDMSIMYNTEKANKILGEQSNYNALDFKNTGKNLLALFIQGIVYFVFNLLLQYKFFVSLKPSDVPKCIEQSAHEDEDVRNERQRILEKVKFSPEKKSIMQQMKMDVLSGKFKRMPKKSRTDENEDFVKLVNLTKVYRKFKKLRFEKMLAVKSLCLGINKGECFGLIGVNGAGMTGLCLCSYLFSLILMKKCF
jgi:hypothetical protein